MGCAYFGAHLFLLKHPFCDVKLVGVCGPFERAWFESLLCRYAIETFITFTAYKSHKYTL